jgi:hypothetical protein
MTSPTEQRRSFDTAMEHYRRGELTAPAIFTEITAASPMSDAWLERMACGDHSIDTLAATHQHSRALYRETSRIGLARGDLHALPAAPMYLVCPPVTGNHRPGLRLGGDRRRTLREAATLLDDPLITDDTQAAPWHQFVTATLYLKTGAGPTCSASTPSTAGQRHHTTEEVTAASPRWPAPPLVSADQTALRSSNRSRQPTRYWPPTSP